MKIILLWNDDEQIKEEKGGEDERKKSVKIRIHI